MDIVVEITRWMPIIALTLFLVLQLALWKFGIKKVDDTLTVYLWKVIRVFKKDI